MQHSKAPDHMASLVQTLADFRCELRKFIQFSERAALEAGLQPQQHQLLLQIAGASAEAAVTIAYVADRLGLRHNSAVELVGRTEQEDLLRRKEDPSDRRRALLYLTAKGRRLLEELSEFHAQELNDRAPELIRTLTHIRRTLADSKGVHA